MVSDAQWNDDFHHCLRTLLTGERTGYYEDYGEFAQLVKAYREGFVYSGEYSTFRRRRHGSSSRDIPAERFVVFAQNHDQVGNRMFGDRLSEVVSFEELKLAAGLVILVALYSACCSWAKNMPRRRRFPISSAIRMPNLSKRCGAAGKAEFAAFRLARRDARSARREDFFARQAQS